MNKRKRRTAKATRKRVAARRSGRRTRRGRGASAARGRRAPVAARVIGKRTRRRLPHKKTTKRRRRTRRRSSRRRLAGRAVKCVPMGSRVRVCVPKAHARRKMIGGLVASKNNNKNEMKFGREKNKQFDFRNFPDGVGIISKDESPEKIQRFNDAKSIADVNKIIEPRVTINPDVEVKKIPHREEALAAAKAAARAIEVAPTDVNEEVKKSLFRNITQRIIDKKKNNKKKNHYRKEIQKHRENVEKLTELQGKLEEEEEAKSSLSSVPPEKSGNEITKDDLNEKAIEWLDGFPLEIEGDLYPDFPHQIMNKGPPDGLPTINDKVNAIIYIYKSYYENHEKLKEKMDSIPKYSDKEKPLSVFIDYDNPHLCFTKTTWDGIKDYSREKITSKYDAWFLGKAIEDFGSVIGAFPLRLTQ